MKKMTSTLLLGSIITATLLLLGCGSEATTSLKSPKDTTKLTRTGSVDETDWTWFVGTDASLSPSSISFDTYFMQGIPKEVKHFQYFLDTDNNADTGFSYGEDSWKISGADYLLEDGDLYQSNSTTVWKWTYIGKFDNFTQTLEGEITKINISSLDSAITELGTKSKTINITIEPFDKNWDSTYSTISTQAVTWEDSYENNTSVKTTKELIQEQLGSSYSIERFVLTPDKKGAVVGLYDDSVLGTDISVYFYDLTNPQKPVQKKLIQNLYANFSGYYTFDMIGNNQVAYSFWNDNLRLTHVLYDYIQHKQIHHSIINELLESKIHSTLPNIKYSVNSSEYPIEKDGNTYLMRYTIHRSSVDPELNDIHAVCIFNANTNTYHPLSQNSGIAGQGDGVDAKNFRMDKEANIIYYDLVRNYDYDDPNPVKKSYHY